MGTGEFQKPRRQPECPQTLRACNPDFAPKWLGEHAAPADKPERSFLHLLCAGQEMATSPGQADAVAMAGEQHRADLVFQLFDSPRNAVTGHAQPACCRSKAAGARHFEEDPDAFPVRNSAIAFPITRMLNFVSTDSRI